MAKSIIVAQGMPLDEPSMEVPGELVHREADHPGNAKFGWSNVHNTSGHQKGNREPSTGQARPDPQPLRNARSGR